MAEHLRNNNKGNRRYDNGSCDDRVGDTAKARVYASGDCAHIQDETKDEVLSHARKIEGSLEGLRTKVDDREMSPGWKFNEWELKGVPIRIEIGPKDIAAGQVVMVRRDTLAKETVKISDVSSRVKSMLEEINRSMYEKALKFLKDNTHQVKTYDELKSGLLKGGVYQAFWCSSQECEEKIKEETKAKIVNIPFEQPKALGECVFCKKKGKMLVNIARSY
jgi:prolyl-tRNA synthetase